MRDLVLVGRVTGAVGLKGDVRLQSFTEDLSSIGKLGPLMTEDGRKFDIEMLRPQTKAFAARLRGVASREAAEALKGTALYVPRDRLPPPKDEEYYLSDLIGLTAFHAAGATLGKVVAVENFGAGDLLEVEIAAEKRTVYVPFTKGIVPVVDIAGGRIVIDPPPGLFDETSSEAHGEEQAS